MMEQKAAPSKSKTKSEAKKEPRERVEIDREEFTIRKRVPPRFPKRKNDVYVTRKTNFEAQLKRCQKLIDSNEEVFIHGLGTAVDRAVNIALQLKEAGLGTLDLDCRTSTVELTDDLEPNNDEQEAGTRTRNNSAIHIRVFRPNPASSDGKTASS